MNLWPLGLKLLKTISSFRWLTGAASRYQSLGIPDLRTQLPSSDRIGKFSVQAWVFTGPMLTKILVSKECFWALQRQVFALDLSKGQSNVAWTRTRARKLARSFGPCSCPSGWVLLHELPIDLDAEAGLVVHMHEAVHCLCFSGATDLFNLQPRCRDHLSPLRQLIAHERGVLIH